MLYIVPSEKQIEVHVKNSLQVKKLFAFVLHSCSHVTFTLTDFESAAQKKKNLIFRFCPNYLFSAHSSLLPISIHCSALGNFLICTWWIWICQRLQTPDILSCWKEKSVTHHAIYTYCLNAVTWLKSFECGSVGRHFFFFFLQTELDIG